MATIRLDLNSSKFQESLFSLEHSEATRVFSSLREIRRLTWEELYRAPGFKWEAIDSATSTKGHRLYSFRITQKCKAVAYREGDFLRLQDICPGHDSADR